MDLTEDLICPKCNNNSFTIKREATYVYSYKFSSEDVIETNDKTKALPFLFNNREKTSSKEFIECDYCAAKYQVSLNKCNKDINLTILQKAIRSDIVENPEFLG